VVRLFNPPEADEGLIPYRLSQQSEDPVVSRGVA